MNNYERLENGFRGLVSEVLVSENSKKLFSKMSFEFVSDAKDLEITLSQRRELNRNGFVLVDSYYKPGRRSSYSVSDKLNYVKEVTAYINISKVQDDVEVLTLMVNAFNTANTKLRMYEEAENCKFSSHIQVRRVSSDVI